MGGEWGMQMAFVDKDFYVTRSTRSGRRNPHGKGSKRNWWMVKAANNGARVEIGAIYMPLKYFGKKVRIKLELMEDENKNPYNHP